MGAIVPPSLRCGVSLNGLPKGPKVKKQPRNFKVLFKILWMFIKRLADAPPYRWRREWTERGKRNVLRSLSTWAPARDTEAQWL
ncbi:hypothetical protein VULLAG_LOCUS3443 [Vulpes lagopus]